MGHLTTFQTVLAKYCPAVRGRAVACWLAVLVCGIAANRVHADVISNLFSTGVDNAGNPLADGSVDSHYTMVTTPNGPGSNAFVTNSSAYPLVNGPWLANSTPAPNGIPSKWISVTADQSGGAAVGRFIYETTFTIGNGLNPNTASIIGTWIVDNPASIYLNQSKNSINSGTATASTFINSEPTFTTFTGHNFTISSGFVQGTNVLDIATDNLFGPIPNPNGIRVSLAGTVFPGFTSVPEPATLFGAGFGILGIAGYSLRRRRAFA